jgi:predicted aspartyl protease
MKAKGANGVGRFSVEFEIANHDDVRDAERGRLAPQKVRRMKISGIVDPGAALLVLPESVVKQLGLPIQGKVKVQYADRRKANRDSAEQANVQILGRRGVFTAIVEPRRQTASIGAIVLEALDFLVDCRRQRLVPRDPQMIFAEIE